MHSTFFKEGLFSRDERLVIDACNGKESTVFAYLLGVLNPGHDVGLELVLLIVDECAHGYCDRAHRTG